MKIYKENSRFQLKTFIIFDLHQNFMKKILLQIAFRNLIYNSKKSKKHKFSKLKNLISFENFFFTVKTWNGNFSIILTTFHTMKNCENFEK